ncbi:hypothetical protein LOTGIDRAFT_235576 [Lottia gigantea]|uniref:Uncharacterized protein n=1 Tax=Lottia gigantea TaxID=225164 RepID=V4BAJ2_LOTGI|nr:hypothetical protein LOTGIDRAFT_235576 [Lottia gigantea]ESO85979.1 hypothetical protein LOTGIDRAFT_235576 [Lottia gigantea]
MSVHRTISDLEREEVFRLIESKKERVEKDSQKWKPEVIKKQMEDDLARRVREALETPPLERMQRKKEREHKQKQRDLQKQNSHLLINLNEASENKQFKKWKENFKRLQSESPVMNLTTISPVEYLFRDQLSKSNQDEYPGVFGLENCSEGIRNIRDSYSTTLERFPPIKPKVKHFYTKDGFLQALKSGKLPHGFENVNESGSYKDKYGLMRNKLGPFWPSELVPYYPAPQFLVNNSLGVEPLYFQLPEFPQHCCKMFHHPVQYNTIHEC